MRDQSLRFVCAALFCAILLGGCGGPKVSGVKVTGTLIKDGVPFQVPDKSELTIGFYGTASDGKSISSGAPYDPVKGTFQVPGPTGNGLPAGNYLITLRCTPYAGADDQDLFEMAFLIGPDAKTPYTPLTYVVTALSQQAIVIDISNKLVTAK
jgi:hypothetical protein